MFIHTDHNPLVAVAAAVAVAVAVAVTVAVAVAAAVAGEAAKYLVQADIVGWAKPPQQQ